jgi:hypothetical protein
MFPIKQLTVDHHSRNHPDSKIACYSPPLSMPLGAGSLTDIKAACPYFSRLRSQPRGLAMGTIEPAKESGKSAHEHYNSL